MDKFFLKGIFYIGEYCVLLSVLWSNPKKD